MIGAAIEEIKSGGQVTVARICRRAGVFVSTFYRHYHNLGGLITMHENNLIRDFEKLIEVAKNNQLPVEHLFKKWAWFIYQNREAFYLSVLVNQLSLLMLMTERIRPLTTAGWRSSPQKTAQVYLIYSYEVAGIWIDWAEREQFNVEQIPKRAKELSFLTRTALQRLGGVVGE
ncbi:TetR/AcrR family transcriptional regulator [Candidatus Saccharibacteria bacterium]|nr:TetR/AcrR family transcriptional regulator [Candidatus Saccharibacteria bacterium]